MTIVSINLTTNDLLKGVEQLDGADLDEFVQKVLHIRAKRFAESFNKEETDLMEQINVGLSQKELNELDLLIQKSEEGTLTNNELENYQELSEKMENLNMKRMSALAQLANIRGVSLDSIMEELGLLKIANI